VEKYVETFSQPSEANAEGDSDAERGRSRGLCKLLIVNALPSFDGIFGGRLSVSPAKSAIRLLHRFAARVLRKSIQLPKRRGLPVVTLKYSPGQVMSATPPALTPSRAKSIVAEWWRVAGSAARVIMAL
jgi:hypothetical protein